MTPDENYERTVECTYKGRRYLVRDNGAILRIPKEGQKPGKWDNVWTLGEPNKYDGYRLLASAIRVHQVVCTAFNGQPPLPNMVVDHRDCNRSNNRPENLRWLTRLQNALNNEATRKKIEYYVGSIEAFLKDPSILRGKVLSTDISWMRTVTKEEAAACLANMQDWAKKDSTKEPSGKGIGEWIYSRPSVGYSPYRPAANAGSRELPFPFKEIKEYHEKQVQTPLMEWRVVGHGEECLFPQLPLESLSESNNVLQQYMDALTPGVDFMLSRYYKATVSKVVFFEKENRFRVLCERIVKDNKIKRTKYYIFEVWNEDGKMYHRKIGAYSKKKKYEEQAMADLMDLSVTGWLGSECYSYVTYQDRGLLRISKRYHYLPPSLAH